MLLLFLEFELSIVLSRPKTTMGNYGWRSCSHAKARCWRDQMLGTSVPEVYMSGRFHNSHLRHLWINRSNKPRRSSPFLGNEKLRNHLSKMDWTCNVIRWAEKRLKCHKFMPPLVVLFKANKRLTDFRTWMTVEVQFVSTAHLQSRPA